MSAPFVRLDAEIGKIHQELANVRAELNLTLVLDNLAVGADAVDAFVSDYQRFRAYMLAPADDAGATDTAGD